MPFALPSPSLEEGDGGRERGGVGGDRESERERARERESEREGEGRLAGGRNGEGRGLASREAEESDRDEGQRAPASPCGGDMQLPSSQNAMTCFPPEPTVASSPPWLRNRSILLLESARGPGYGNKSALEWAAARKRVEIGWKGRNDQQRQHGTYGGTAGETS